MMISLHQDSSASISDGVDVRIFVMTVTELDNWLCISEHAAVASTCCDSASPTKKTTPTATQPVNSRTIVYTNRM